MGDDKESKMIIVTGSAIAREETFEAVQRLSLEHVHRSRAEPGCISHNVLIDPENHLRFEFIERWTDRAALRAHFGVPASREFVRALRSLVAEMTTIEIYEASRLDGL